MARRSIPLDAGSSLPQNICACLLRRLLFEQLAAILRAPVRCPQRGRGVPLALPAMAPRLPRASLVVKEDAAARRTSRADSSDLNRVSARERRPGAIGGEAKRTALVVLRVTHQSLENCSKLLVQEVRGREERASRGLDRRAILPLQNSSDLFLLFLPSS